MNKIWEHRTTAQVESTFVDNLRIKFLTERPEGAITLAEEFIIGGKTVLDLAAVAKDAVGGEILLTGENSQILIALNENAIISFIDKDRQWYRHRGLTPSADAEYSTPNVESIRTFLIEVTAKQELAEKAIDFYRNFLGSVRLASVEWWYQGEHGAATRVSYLPPPKTVLHKEFYPNLGDPKEFLKDYLQDEASILLMAGPPGTGKTTLLRHLICDFKLTAHLIYDESLMKNDKVFQNFLFGRGDVLIIEDADEILTQRDSATGNKLMSRFLGVSDGLIKLPNKKVVFTTNINDFSRIDTALIRPGRCYGLVHTRHLTLNEAQAASKVANLPIPMDGNEWTLAELFNQHVKTVAIRKVGF